MSEDFERRKQLRLAMETRRAVLRHSECLMHIESNRAFRRRRRAATANQRLWANICRRHRTWEKQNGSSNLWKEIYK